MAEERDGERGHGGSAALGGRGEAEVREVPREGGEAEVNVLKVLGFLMSDELDFIPSGVQSEPSNPQWMARNSWAILAETGLFHFYSTYIFLFLFFIFCTIVN